MLSEHGHTEREKRVIAATVELARAFGDLVAQEGVSHPSHTADVVSAVHEVQRIVAMRLARRVEPEVWEVRQPGAATSAAVELLRRPQGC